MVRGSGVKKYIIFAFFISFLFLLAEETNSPLKKISENLYQIESITIDVEKTEISFPIEVNMREGVIEYMLCSTHGKLHESVLKTDIVPSHLNIALLLLGLEAGQNIDYQRQDRLPQGDSLYIYIKWDQNNEIIPIEKLGKVTGKKEIMQPAYWTFLGSKFENDVYMADVQKSIISTCHDPYAIIDLPLRTASEVYYYEVNSEELSDDKTKGTIFISKYPREIE
ncbi:MAG: YdjY domain-containing protein [Bacteroidales bacterium]|nr:YdjY domain-containing protein [Bacteroidales bacterium]